MWRPTPGDVIPYSYLWWREHEAGEDSGRKVRPCVVVIAVRKVGADSIRIVVAPITHSAPSNRAAVELPARVKQQLKLDDERSWVICDEVNHFEWPGFDFGRTPGGVRTYGRVPDALVEAIRLGMRSTALRMIDRD